MELNRHFIVIFCGQLKQKSLDLEWQPSIEGVRINFLPNYHSIGYMWWVHALLGLEGVLPGRSIRQLGNNYYQGDDNAIILYTCYKADASILSMDHTSSVVSINKTIESLHLIVWMGFFWLEWQFFIVHWGRLIRGWRNLWSASDTIWPTLPR